MRVDLMMKFSDVYVLAGEKDKARELAKKAEKLSQQFIDQDPTNEKWQRLLFGSAFRTGDLTSQTNPDTALEHYSRALQLAREMAAAPPNDDKKQIAFIENKIGDMFVDKDLELALSHYQASLAIGEKLVMKDSDDLDSQKIVGDARKRMGDLLLHYKKIPEAVAEYKSALLLFESIAKKEQENDVYQSNLAKCHHWLGRAYYAAKQPYEALREYEIALKIERPLHEKDPDNIDWQIALAREYAAMGEASKLIDP
jgi:tetratricopeptide (TPR) repeat protein